MPNFWTYITKGAYSIGCTGQSVYVYKDGAELCCLKGFRYTYMACFSPDEKYFALKSGEGLLYLYSLESLDLIQKIRFGNREDPQDGMFTFTSRSDAIVSIDSSHGGTRNRIRFYSVPELAVTNVLYEDSDASPLWIEPGAGEEEYYALLREYPEPEDPHRSIALVLLRNGEIVKKFYITKLEGEFYPAFLELKSRGFTPKAKQWSPLRYAGYDLTNIEKKKHSLASLFAYYENRIVG